MRTWSGLTGLREVLARLRPRVKTYRDAAGRELFDVPGAPWPAADAPAPPRFLPEYDNVLLSHADRSRMLNGHGPGLPFPRGSWIGKLLVDGFYRANWSVEEEERTATVIIDRFTSLSGDPADSLDAIRDEAERLLTLVSPEASERPVRFVPDP